MQEIPIGVWLPLYNGGHFLVDREVAGDLSQKLWVEATASNGRKYIRSHWSDAYAILRHVLVNARNGAHVLHKNGNHLDCRIDNLRVRESTITVDGDIAIVSLGNTSQVAVCDSSDVGILSGISWSINDYGYATAGIRGRNVSMHRLIMGAIRKSNGLEVDHKDGDRLNNRRCNLRMANRQQQSANTKKMRDCTSILKGVYVDFRASGPKKFKATITVDGRARHLGRFASELEAARAYDAAASEIFGEFARLNFPLKESA